MTSAMVGVGPAPFRFVRGIQQSMPEAEHLDIPVADQVEWLLKHLGEQITAAAVGVDDGVVLHNWAEEVLVVPKDQEERLTLLFSVALRIETRFDDDTVQRFFVSDNPSLDDAPPLEIVAVLAPDVARARLMGAVRALLGR